MGDIGPGGGIVFYDAGSTQSWGRYLEAACAGWQNNCDGTTADPQVVWGCDESSISGADGLAIGTGAKNTTDILAGCSDAGIAADRADDYSHNTLDDWFLPSKDELNALCKWAFGDTVNTICNDDSNGSLSLTNGDFYGTNFWSSSEVPFVSDDFAWYQDFGGGFQYYGFKDDTTYVRPVRAF